MAEKQAVTDRMQNKPHNVGRANTDGEAGQSGGVEGECESALCRTSTNHPLRPLTLSRGLLGGTARGDTQNETKEMLLTLGRARGVEKRAGLQDTAHWSEQ